MTLLLIETATETCSVALCVDHAVLASVTVVPQRSHVAELTSCIAQCMRTAGVSLASVDAIAVSSGPGAYTSLRTGVATAKGFCYALDKPLIAVDTLQALAWGARAELPHVASDEVLMPMLDARRDEVWTALFDTSLNVLIPATPLVLSNNSFEKWRTAHNVTGHVEKVILSGNGAEKARSGHFFEGSVKICARQSLASYLWALAKEKFEKSDFQDIAYFEPFYMKPPNITTSKNVVF